MLQPQHVKSIANFRRCCQIAYYRHSKSNVWWGILYMPAPQSVPSGGTENAEKIRKSHILPNGVMPYLRGRHIQGTPSKIWLGMSIIGYLATSPEVGKGFEHFCEKSGCNILPYHVIFMWKVNTSKWQISPAQSDRRPRLRLRYHSLDASS